MLVDGVNLAADGSSDKGLVRVTIYTFLKWLSANSRQVSIVDTMLKLRRAGDGSYHKPVKQLVSKVSAIELVAELIEVLLQELRLDTVVYVLHQRLWVADCDVNPRKYFPDFLGQVAGAAGERAGGMTSYIMQNEQNYAMYAIVGSNTLVIWPLSYSTVCEKYAITML